MSCRLASQVTESVIYSLHFVFQVAVDWIEFSKGERKSGCQLAPTKLIPMSYVSDTADVA